MLLSAGISSHKVIIGLAMPRKSTFARKNASRMALLQSLFGLSESRPPIAQPRSTYGTRPAISSWQGIGMYCSIHYRATATVASPFPCFRPLRIFFQASPNLYDSSVLHAACYWKAIAERSVEVTTNFKLKGFSECFVTVTCHLANGLLRKTTSYSGGHYQVLVSLMSCSPHLPTFHVESF